MSALLLALLLTFTGTARGLHAQAAPPPPSITAVGCVVQLADDPAAPPTGHEEAAAKGLALTRVNPRARDARGIVPRSAVPGSQPSGTGTGTTDRATPPNRGVEAEQSFWIVGAKAAELLRLLGRRVEVTGTLDERLAANPGRATITDAGAAPARRAATAPPEPPSNAHPSAPTRAISISTFRVVEGSCS